MKGLAEMIAENDAIVARARKRERDAIRRLKQRVARIFRGWHGAGVLHRDVTAAIDAWHAAEQKRAGR